jgi:hypothetical protein
MRSVPRYVDENALRLAAEWTRVGGGFTVPAAQYPVEVEDLLIRSIQAGPMDYRVFFVAATWLGVHESLVDVRKLGKRVAVLCELESAVAGALLDLAQEAGATALSHLAQRCVPLSTPRPLFETYVEYPELSARVKEHSLPIFLKWGLWHDEISLKPGAIRPISWILKHCPELRIRALVGPGLESDVLLGTWSGPSSITSLSETLGASYAATHEAVERLLHRGLVTAKRESNRRMIGVTHEMRSWLDGYPQAQGVAAPAVGAPVRRK